MCECVDPCMCECVDPCMCECVDPCMCECVYSNYSIGRHFSTYGSCWEISYTCQRELSFEEFALNA